MITNKAWREEKRAESGEAGGVGASYEARHRRAVLSDGKAVTIRPSGMKHSKCV
jgi:hypothetical protein